MAEIVTQRIQPILGLIASRFYSLDAVYHHSALNKVWEAAARTDGPSSAPPAVPPPPPG